MRITGSDGTTDHLTVNALGGNDTVDASGLVAGLIRLTVIGGAGNDALIGSQGGDTFVWNPGDGSDTIEGRGGLDVLTFNGSDAAETFVISRNGGHVRLTSDAGNVMMDLNGVEFIDLNARAGADTIVVNDLTGTGLILVEVDLSGPAGDGQADSVILSGTNSDDAIRLGASGNTVLVVGLSPAVDITGSDGTTDHLTVNTLGGNDTVDSTGLPANLIGLTVNLGDGQGAAANVAPSFATGPDQVATDESGPESIPGWATDISPGPLSEAGQSLHFIILNNTHPELFAVAPMIDANGTLTFTPAPNARGTSQITIQLQDDGGTANGGSDTSRPQKFNITVNKPQPSHNTANALDVTGDGHIDPTDALVVINFLNTFGSGALPANAAVGPPFYDVDSDGFVTPTDALLVINTLNAGQAINALNQNGSGSEIETATSATGPSATAAQSIPPSAGIGLGDIDNLNDLIAMLAVDTAGLIQRQR